MQDSAELACVLGNFWLLIVFLELEFIDSYLQYWKIILLWWTKASEWWHMSVKAGCPFITISEWSVMYCAVSDANIHTSLDCLTR